MFIKYVHCDNIFKISHASLAFTFSSGTEKVHQALIQQLTQEHPSTSTCTSAPLDELQISELQYQLGMNIVSLHIVGPV